MKFLIELTWPNHLGKNNIEMHIQKKIFLTKFLYSQYRNKEENTEGTEDLFLYRQIFVKSVFVRTIFDCSYYLQKLKKFFSGFIFYICYMYFIIHMIKLKKLNAG